jgi:hypothetical protein
MEKMFWKKKRHISKKRFETLLKKFDWKNLHSEWRKCSGTKKTIFKNRFETLLKCLNGEISILNGNFSILNGKKCSGKKTSKKIRNASKKV